MFAWEKVTGGIKSGDISHKVMGGIGAGKVLGTGYRRPEFDFKYMSLNTLKNEDSLKK